MPALSCQQQVIEEKGGDGSFWLLVLLLYGLSFSFLEHAVLVGALRNGGGLSATFGTLILLWYMAPTLKLNTK